VVPREAAPRSDLKPATIPKRSPPPFRSISGRVSEKVGVFVWVSPSGIKSLVDQRGRSDAGQERTDHATDTTNATAFPWRGGGPGERAHPRGGALTDPGQSQAGPRARGW